MEGFLSPPQTPSLAAAIHLRPLFHGLHDLMAHSQSGIQAMMGRVFLAKKVNGILTTSALRANQIRLVFMGD